MTVNFKGPTKQEAEKRAENNLREQLLRYQIVSQGIGSILGHGGFWRILKHDGIPGWGLAGTMEDFQAAIDLLKQELSQAANMLVLAHEAYDKYREHAPVRAARRPRVSNNPRKAKES